MTRASGGEHERLAVLVGTWRTEGWTRETPEHPAARIEAADTYQWLPGGSGLLHTVDARVGDQKVDGAEIIGYDPSLESYRTLYFGTDGPAAYEASLSEEGEAVVWEMRSEDTKFAGTFDADGDAINGRWERLNEDTQWQPWMDITLTRQGT